MSTSNNTPCGLLNKGALLPEELRSFIYSKLEGIKAIPGLYEKEIDRVVQIIPRTSLTNPDVVDQKRRVSNKTSEKIQSNKVQYEQMSSKTDRKQAHTTVEMKTHTYRKKIQYDWFQLTPLKKDFTCNAVSAWIYLNSNPTPLKTEEFVNLIDQLTINVLRGSDETWKANRKELIKLTLQIVFLRHEEAELRQNNLSDSNGYRNWLTHAWIITSFATYLVVLCSMNTQLQDGAKWEVHDLL